MNPTHAHRRLCLACLAIGILFLGACQTTPSDTRRDAAPVNPFDEEFAQAAERQPTAGTLYAMARMLKSRGRYEQSIYVLHHILETHPAFVPAYNDLAELRISRNEINRAVDTLRTGLEHAPDSPILLNNLGMCHLILGEFGSALARFSQAHALDPAERRFAANNALALGLLGQYDQCLDAYKHIVPTADAHYNLAVICESQKDFERAEREFASAERIKQEQAARARLKG